MKKILLVLLIITICFLLIGCEKENNNQNNNQNNSENNNENENTIVTSSNTSNNAKRELDFKYTTYEKMIEENLLSDAKEEKKEYAIGTIKLGSKSYVAKYVYDSIKNEDITIISRIIFLYDDNNEMKLRIALNDPDKSEYISEISVFKNKYLVLLTGTQTKDSLQRLYIYDSELNDLGLNNTMDGLIVNTDYGNYYSINDDAISFVYTKADKKVEGKIQENENGKLYIEEQPGTTEGVVPYTGRTLDSVQ